MRRNPGSKGKSKLTKNEFKELKKLIKERKLTGNRQIKKLIYDEFGVVYSERQVSRIMDN